MELYELFDDVDASAIKMEETCTLDLDRIRMLTLSRLPKKARRPRLTGLLLAAAIAAALALSAVAYDEFIRYGDPQGMLEDAYGSTDALDPAAAEQAAPYIASVEETLVEGSRTVTVHGHLYDSVTGAGVIYYTVEDPAGVDVNPAFDGQITTVPGMFYGSGSYGYVLEATDNNVEIAEFYLAEEGRNYLELQLSHAGEYVSAEEEFSLEQNAIRLPLEDGGGMEGLLAEGIRLSPIALVVDASRMDFLYSPEFGENSPYAIQRLAIRFRDGSKYVIEEGTRAFALERGNTLAVGFHRLVNPGDVEAVCINDREITDLRPISEEERLRPAPYVERPQALDTAQTAPGEGISFGDMTLVPGELQYDGATGAGLLRCHLTSEVNLASLIHDNLLYPQEIGLETNQIGRWLVKNAGEKEADLTFAFLAMEQESPYVKLWFRDSPADPRLDAATENLAVRKLEGEKARSFGNGAVVLSDYGMRIDYEALNISQGSMPKNLSLTFTDGRELVLSDWDREILDCLWLNTTELVEAEKRELRIGFFEAIDSDSVESVTYAGNLLTK